MTSTTCPTPTLAEGPDERESVSCMFCAVDDASLYARAKSRYDDRWFDVVRCRRCGLVYTSPRTANKPAQIEKRPRSESLFKDCAELQAEQTAAELQVRRLERFCHPGRLLDFGCGKGVLVHQATRRGWDAYGVELNRNLVEAANEYWHDSRLLSDPLEVLLVGHPSRFDAIVATQVFEHLSHPLKILRVLRELLKPGGTMLIDVPNLHCLEERLKRGATLDPTAHLYYFTSETLRRLLGEAGFTGVACWAAPNNLGIYRRLLGRLAGSFLPAALANLTERLPLPRIGKGVFAVGHAESHPHPG